MTNPTTRFTASLSRRRLIAIGTGLTASAVLAACGAAATPTPAPAAAKPPAPAAAPAAATAPAAAPAATTAPAAPAAAAAATKPPEAAKPAEAAKPTVAPAAGPAGAKPGVEFQVATRGALDGEIMEKSLVKFNATTGNKGVHVSYGPQPEYWAKVQAQHATKQVADVIWASSGGIFSLAAKGVLAELEPLIQTDKYNIEDYVKAGLDSLRYNGKLYGMPWGGHPGTGGVQYNVDLLQKAGLNVTEDASSFDNVTWDQMIEAGKKITSGDVFAFYPGRDFLSVTNFTGSFGGEFLSPDGKTLTIETPEFKKGLQVMYDFFVTHKISPVPDPKVNGEELFGTGKLAMNHTGYWGQFQPGPKAIADKFKWGVGLTPKGSAGKRGTSLTINGQTVSSASTKKDVAWGFTKFILDPEQNVEIVLSGGGRPALRRAVLENERLMKEMKAHKVFVASIQSAEPWKQPANLRWEEFNTTIVQSFANLWLGKENVDQAIASAKPKLQAVLDKPLAN